MEVHVASEEWAPGGKVAVVTGPGKGIGLEIVKALLNKGVRVLLSLRKEEHAQELAEKLENEFGCQVPYHTLDITVPASVEEFTNWVGTEFKGIDILVNNAGHIVDPVKNDLEEAMPVLEVNYYGTKRLIEALLPLINEGGQIVNLSTVGGRLDILNNEWKEKLSDLDTLTEATVEEFVAAYLEDVKQGSQFGKGWPETFHRMDYCVSKMALNAYTRYLAKRLTSEGRKIYVNCTSPGHTSSVMSGHTGHSPAEGCLTAVWLALLPPSEAQTGKYFIRKKDVGFTNIPLAHFDQLIYDVEDIKKHLHEQSKYTTKESK